MVTKVLTLLPLISLAWGQDAPRGASVYSSFPGGAYWYRDEHGSVFARAGVELDRYENTEFAELVGALARYAIVVLGAVYNYENTQDLAAYAPAVRSWVERGGCLVVTDANYPSAFGWLTALDAALRWTCRGELNPWHESPPSWVAASHPLLDGVKPPTVPWTRPTYWSSLLTPLVADGDGCPVVAYLEIGNGIVVVSSAYRQYGFPDAAFIRNLLSWVRDPERIAEAQERQERARSARQSPEGVTVPVMTRAPEVDGTIGEEEWESAVSLPPFVRMDGIPSGAARTLCRLGQTEQGLFIAFECYDEEPPRARHTVADRDGPVWTDDWVEVFLDPSGGRAEPLHFAVSAGGAQYDERGWDASWDRYWVARTAVRPGVWTAELYIPYASLDITTQKPPAPLWKAEFYRGGPAQGDMPTVTSGASPTAVPSTVQTQSRSLDGMQVPVEKYLLSPDITVETPERWYGGGNPVTAVVMALPDRAASFSVEAVTIDGEVLGATPGVALGPGETARFTVTVQLKADTAQSFQLVARDAAEPERILASSRFVRALPQPLMKVTLLAPIFRGTVQSRDVDKSLRLACRVGDPGPATGELRLRVSVIPQGQMAPVLEKVQAAPPRSEMELVVSLADLAPAEYEVRIELQDEADRVFARDQRQVRVAAPAPVEVTFDAKRACRVNGQPVFPIGLYHVSEPALEYVNARARELGLPELTLEQALRDCRDHGFNTVVRGWGMPGEEFMEVAERLGIWVMPEVGAPDIATLKDMVTFANRFGNVLAWYGIDEPAGERLEQAIEAHQRFAEADPHRPVSAACNNPLFFANALRAYDLLMTDPYMIFPDRGQGLEAVAGWIAAGTRAGGGRVPVWAVPQAFAIDNAWDEPTPEELRCQAYLCIVNGATGLIWYAWYTTEPWSGNPKGRNQWFLPDSRLWPAFAELNAEINELVPVILEGEARGPATADNPSIHSHMWEAEGAITLIAVNPRTRALTCRFRGLPKTVAEVLFEGREVLLVDGEFSDEFAPHAVHVYRLR